MCTIGSLYVNNFKKERAIETNWKWGKNKIQLFTVPGTEPPIKLLNR
jgi:hypothetical protein